MADWRKGFQKRLRGFIKDRYGPRSAFEKATGLGHSTVAHWFQGEGASMNAQQLRTIGKLTGASLDWLVLGKGEPLGVSRNSSTLALDVHTALRHELERRGVELKRPMGRGGPIFFPRSVDDAAFGDFMTWLVDAVEERLTNAKRRWEDAGRTNQEAFDMLRRMPVPRR